MNVDALELEQVVLEMTADALEMVQEGTDILEVVQVKVEERLLVFFSSMKMEPSLLVSQTVWRILNRMEGSSMVLFVIDDSDEEMGLEVEKETGLEENVEGPEKEKTGRTNVEE